MSDTRDLQPPRFSTLTGVIYFVGEDDLDEARDWYARLLQVEPYMERTYFVTFKVADLEWCIHKASDKAWAGTHGQTAYWQVDDLETAAEWFLHCGATPYRRLLEIDEGGFVLQFQDPFGNIIGLRERLPPE